jgi:putative sterol carrier protein
MRRPLTTAGLLSGRHRENATSGSIGTVQQPRTQRIADSLARGYARTPPRLRALALRGPQRRLVLAEIFRTMERSFDREKGKAVEAVLRWEIARARGGADRWQVVLEDGRCRANRALDREPTITIKCDGPTFLDLVSGTAQGPALFMSQRLRVDGDPMLAARLTTLFRVPRPRLET